MGMSAELSKGDILPLVNIIWDSSFGRVVTNMKAIRERGWNPANRCLLTDPDIMKTRIVESTTTNATTATDSTSDSVANVVHTTDSVATNTNTATDSISDSIPSVAHTPNPVSTNTTSATDSSPTRTIDSSNTTIATPVHPSPWIDLTNVNFENGLAGDYTIDIIQHFVREKNVAENLNKRYKEGSDVREGIDLTKRLTGGTMFNGNKIVLDKEIFNIREGKELEKSDAREKVIQSAIDK